MKWNQKWRYGFLALALSLIINSPPALAADEYKGLADESSLSNYTGLLIEINEDNIGKDGLIRYNNELYTGRVIEQRPNEGIQAVYQVVSGKREGFYHLYYPTGNIDLAIIYQNGEVIQETGYFPDGVHVQYAYQINGDRGTVTQYADPTGKLDIITEFRFADSKNPRSQLIRDGKQVQYSPNGKIQSEIYYKNNVANGSVVLYYPTGELKIKATAKDGQYKGAVNVYYPSGALKETIENVSGPVENNTVGYVLNGNYKLFSENGILTSEKTLKNLAVSVHPTQDEINSPATATADPKGDVTIVNNTSDDNAALVVAGTALVVGAAIYDDNYYDYWDDWGDWGGWGPPPPPPPPPHPPGPPPHPPGPNPPAPGPGPHPDPGPHPNPPSPPPKPDPSPARPGEGGSGTQHVKPQPAPEHPGQGGSGTQHVKPQPGQGGSGIHRPSGGGEQHVQPHPQVRPHPQFHSGGFHRGGFRRR